MIRILLILPLAISVAGCPLDKLAKPNEPSSFQQHVQNVAAITAPYTEPTVEVAPEPPAAPTYTTEGPLVAAPVPPPPPSCFEEFRIRRCVAGQPVDWFYGDAPGTAPAEVVVAAPEVVIADPVPTPPTPSVVTPTIPVAEVEPVVVPPPVVECVADEFRVSRCVEGKVMPW